ncbi:aminotransferase class I/II-fold pyridoxal phosphate-dependent enzyme, partial [candidate division FCPU426 bacterium]|nr:aminotransferase class I/II-fold pyridoxal phosphate-dependent enzyme [candidate division FCPU426 bacterium]
MKRFTHGEAGSEVRFVNIPKQHHGLKKELLQALAQVIEGGAFILGKEVQKLEQESARWCNVRYGVGVNSGTDALVLALRALDIGPGDEVIVPDFTFVATASAVALVGATPVLADIDPETYTLDPGEVRRRITPRTRALV